MGVVRCCGTRLPSGIYAECGTSPFGTPIEECLVDPPTVVDADSFGITPVGVKLIQDKTTGVWHIFDWVGSKFYPNLADFVEEVKRLGLSRKLSPILKYEDLSSASRIILLHKRASIKNAAQYKSESACIKGLPNHDTPRPMCIRLWWEDIEGGTVIKDRIVTRTMPSFDYMGQSRPENVEPEYQLAIFASFPIINLAVVNDPKAGKHELSLQKARKARLEVKLVEE